MAFFKPFATSHLLAATNKHYPFVEATKRERVRDSSTDETATLHPLPGDNSAVAPPDPIPNSEVKHSRADGSVAQAMQE